MRLGIPSHSAASTPSRTGTCCCGRSGGPEDRPLVERRDELIASFGQARADWMIGNSRNLCLCPNVYLMDQFSSQIRTYRPIAADKTEMTIYCIAPKGESAEARAQRIRQYEDFFNTSGMATPDDLEEFRACQVAYTGIACPETICAAGRRTGSTAPTRPPRRSDCGH